MVPDGKAITCRLADKGPTRTNVTAHPQATYTYWESRSQETWICFETLNYSCGNLNIIYTSFGFSCCVVKLVMSFVPWFPTGSLPTGTYGLREDGMLYLVVAEKANFTAAKELCSKIPGHRLAITKIIKQYETLLSLATETRKQAAVPKVYEFYRVTDWMYRKTSYAWVMLNTLYRSRESARKHSRSKEAYALCWKSKRMILYFVYIGASSVVPISGS